MRARARTAAPNGSDRWTSEDELLEAEGFFRRHCDRVRVMPFLEGIPCSIHGAIIDDAVIALRPVEMVTLRHLETHRLRYCGTADFWDPPDADREFMRQTARKVGKALQERLAFRGAFTIDGVMTEDGFRPTELNPRYGAGLAPIARAIPDLPLSLVFTAVLAGERLDYRPMELERLLVESADINRGGGAYTVITAAQSHTREVPLVRRSGRLPTRDRGRGADRHTRGWSPARSAVLSPTTLTQNTHQSALRSRPRRRRASPSPTDSSRPASAPCPPLAT